MEVILGAAFFGLVSYVGVLLAGTISFTPFDDGPAPGDPPVPWMVGGAMLVGGLLTARAESAQHMLIYAIVVCALTAIWCTDVRYGIVPDVFTLVPLALVLGIALFQRQPWPFASAFIAFVPFAVLALISKGRGMGWGDVKLVALGGAVLGAQWAIIAFAVACLAAVGVCYVRGKQRGPIAFAPYLTAAIGAAIPMAILH